MALPHAPEIFTMVLVLTSEHGFPFDFAQTWKTSADFSTGRAFPLSCFMQPLVSAATAGPKLPFSEQSLLVTKRTFSENVLMVTYPLVVVCGYFEAQLKVAANGITT